MLYLILYISGFAVIAMWEILIVRPKTIGYPIIPIVKEIYKRDKQTILWVICGINAKTDLQKRVVTERKELAAMLLTNYLIDLLVIVISPVFVIALCSKECYWVHYIILEAIYIWILLRKIKEKTQSWIEFRKRTSRLVCFVRDNLETIWKENKNRIRRKDIILLIGIVVLAILISNLLSDVLIKSNPAYMWLTMGMILVAYWIVPWIKQKKPHCQTVQTCALVIEDMCYGIEDDEDIVKAMCEKLGISNLTWRVVEGYIPSARAIWEKDGYVVEFTCGLLDLIAKECYDYLYPEKIVNVRLALLAHELVHLAYHDGKRIRQRVLCSLIISICALVISTILICLPAVPQIASICILIVVLIFDLLFGKIICDKRYWTQMCELRADCLGVQLAEAGKELVVRMLRAVEEGTIQNNKFLNYYEGYIEIKDHPSIQRRIQVLLKERSWGIWVYFSQLLFIRVNLWSGKGWYG